MTNQSRISLLLLAASLLAGAAAGCSDPVPASARDALGGEAPNVRRGPTHRPGQPCGLCHDGGTANSFAVAGTLYVTPTGTQPLEGAVVTIVDANGATHSLRSNCAGNFYANASEFTLAYPFRVSVSYGGITTPMKTLVHRDNSCASCHTNPPGPASAGHIYLSNDATAPSVTGCN